MAWYAASAPYANRSGARACCTSESTSRVESVVCAKTTPTAGTWQPPQPGMPIAPVAPPRPSPHDILRERLARGEVTVDEYERVRAALGPDPYAPPPATAGQ